MVRAIRDAIYEETKDLSREELKAFYARKAAAMRDERGKDADRLAQGCTTVVLDPDVAKAFPDAASVNEALRKVMAQRAV